MFQQLGLDVRHTERAAWYPLSMLFRNILYVAVIIHCDSHATYQLSILLGGSSTVVAVLLHTKPFENRDNLALSLFNELCVYLTTAAMFGFTELSWDSQNAYMGSLIASLIMAVLVMVLTVNTLCIIHSCVFGALHAYRVRRLRVAKKAWFLKNKHIIFIDFKRRRPNEGRDAKRSP